MVNTEPQLIQGDTFTDERGQLLHVNDFTFDDVRRFYLIHHPDKSVVRAWQGHRVERKYFYVTQGRFVVAWVKIDNWTNPSPELRAESVILTVENSRILSIPAGYANGIKALDNGSKVMVFCDTTLNESVEEKIRFDSTLWFDWNAIQ